MDECIHPLCAWKEGASCASHTERRMRQAIHLYDLHNKTSRRDKLTTDMKKETPEKEICKGNLQNACGKQFICMTYTTRPVDETSTTDMSKETPLKTGNPLKKKICNANLQNACDKEFLFTTYTKDLVKQTCTREPPSKRDRQGKPPKRM